MRAMVDEDACSGCGLCVDICPEVFELSQKEIAEVKADPVPADAEDSCREAAESCPEDAIAVEE